MKKFHIYSSILVALSVGSCSERNIGKKVDLRSVTSFDNIRAFYANIKIRKPMTRPKTNPTDEITKIICKNIFSSHYFQALKNEEWVDVDDDETRTKLEKSHPTIFSAIFRECAIEKKHIRGHYDYIYKYENIYTPLPIYVGDNQECEYVFKCFVRKKDSPDVTLYHVSREYNVDLDPESASPIAGRFVFSYHPEKFMVIEALAEEPAKGLTKIRAALIEFHYSKRRRDNGAVKTRNRDPICRLTSRDKLRLCASVFSSLLYRDKVEFSPTIGNVELECAKRRISFVADLFAPTRVFLKSTGRSLADRNYEEWTIGCTAMSVERRRPTTYHVSRGDDRNTIFVFGHKFPDDRIFVEHYLRRVSVVDGVEQKEVRLEEATKHLGEFSYKSRSARV